VVCFSASERIIEAPFLKSSFHHIIMACYLFVLLLNTLKMMIMMKVCKFKNV